MNNIEKKVTLERQFEAIREACELFLEAIKQLSPVPSGHLYALLAGGINLDTYQRIIAILLESGRITMSNHLITFVK